MFLEIRRTWLWLGLAAAAIAALLVVPRECDRYRAYRLERSLSRLMVESARSRVFYGRLAIARAPMTQSRTRATVARSRVAQEVASAASDVLELIEGQTTERSRHALAMTRYVRGEFDAAGQVLERLAPHSNDAALWCDLAAIRLERSIAANAPHEAVPALIAVDRALRIDSRMDAALYNRAAILERIGLLALAREEWRALLIRERDVAWQMNIRERLRNLPLRSDDEQWMAALERLRAASPQRATTFANEIAQRFPQQARVWAEGRLPTEWADGAVAGDEARARDDLRIASALAHAVRERLGESLAAEAVAEIESAIRSGNATRLANAYLLYLDGRKLYSRQELAAGEHKLVEAARQFSAAGTPMKLAAKYYAVNAIADQGRTREAAVLYENLANQIDPDRHRALAAQLQWQISICHGRIGHWDAALDATNRSIAGFVQLGEKENAGATENLLAEQYDLLGQPERAWKHRATAFRLLSEAGAAFRLQVALAGVSRDRIRRKDWGAAVSLLGLEIEVARVVENPALIADAMARRGRARAALGDLKAAMTDIALARSANAKIGDGGMRAKVGADIDAAEGVIVRTMDRARSIQLLTNAIEYYSDAASVFILPELFLERGRTQRAHGHGAEAVGDFDRGAEQIEANRRNVTAYALQSTAGDVGEDLFLEAIAVAIDRGEVARAFDFSERSRSSALLQRIGRNSKASSRKNPPRAAPGTLLVEFMVLPDRVVIFTLVDELRMTVVPIDRKRLEAMIEELTAHIREERPLAAVHASSQALYDLVLRPIRPLLQRTSVVVFLPNRVLDRLPWAALFDSTSGRYLIEDNVIVMAPSVAFLELAASRSRQQSPPRALVFGNPRAELSILALPPLLGAEKEAKRIAGLYPSAVLRIGADATKEQLLGEAGSYDIVHFGGHAVSSELDDAQSFLVLTPAADRGSGLLYAHEIVEMQLERVRLFVLAACGTVRGPTVHLDGTPSIGRAFLAAGVETVIGTLWDVDDERSAALFTRMHRAIADGRSTAEAVREMQIGAIREGGDLAHPKTWAGVVVMGGGGVETVRVE